MLHRDDIPAEVMEQLLAELQSDNPEIKKVVCIGDMPETPELREMHDKVAKHILQCFGEGLCFECGAKMPIKWPPTKDDFDWPEGWSRCWPLNEDDGMPPMLICPDCD